MTKAVVCFEELEIGQVFTRLGDVDMQFMKTTEVTAKSSGRCNAVCLRSRPGLKIVQGWHYCFKPKTVVKLCCSDENS